jgi:hypothetical protein
MDENQVTVPADHELQMQRWLSQAYNSLLQALYALHNALGLYEPTLVDPLPTEQTMESSDATSDAE